MSDLSGRFAVVTGAARGIGLATARALGVDGATVLLVDRDEDETQATVAELRSGGVDATAAVIDVADAAAATALVEAVAESAPRLDIWVNNASAGVTDAAGAGSFEDGIRSSLVLTGTLCRLMLPMMEARGGGTVVNVSSLAGFVAVGSDWYSAAKAGLIGLTRELAVRHAPLVRVNAVAPGIIKTRRTERYRADAEAAVRVNEKIPLGRLGTVDEVAAVIRFLAGDASSYITGECIIVDGGMYVTRGL